MAIAGVGMVMVSLTRRLSMTMSHICFSSSSAPSSSSLTQSQISTRTKQKLDKRPKDASQPTERGRSSGFSAFFPPSLSLPDWQGVRG